MEKQLKMPFPNFSSRDYKRRNFKDINKITNFMMNKQKYVPHYTFVKTTFLRAHSGMKQIKGKQHHIDL